MKHVCKYSIPVLAGLAFLVCGLSGRSNSESISASIESLDSEPLAFGGASSPSKKSSTATVDDVLSTPKYFFDGTCVPQKVVLEKRETATRKFIRSTGSIFDEMVSPFIWTMPDGSVLKGKGLSSVSMTFDKPGKYVANLNVDGNDISCGQIQMQGIPITVDSCYADAYTVKAGEISSGLLLRILN